VLNVPGTGELGWRSVARDLRPRIARPLTMLANLASFGQVAS